jgi:hypothetical protein
VKEEKPPKGKEPIEWFLAASEPVNTPEEAYEYVGYYIQRWKIERFHYVLKSGCAIEKLQERSIDKTTILILTYSIIAVKILNMTYTAWLTPELPCSLLLGEDEWKLLYCVANKSKDKCGTSGGFIFISVIPAKCGIKAKNFLIGQPKT